MKKTSALIATLLLATPLAAQDRMTPEQCSASWAKVTTLLNTPDASIEPLVDDEGWCLYEDADFAISTQQKFQLESLRWRASDIERFLEDDLPPRSFEVVGEGFSIVPFTGDPVFDYLFELQSYQQNSGFGLSLRWDGVQNEVFVDEAYFDFYPENRIEATARIDGVDLSDQSAMHLSIGKMGLRELNVASQFDGWFEIYVAMALGGELLDRDGDAPEVQVEALKEQAVEFVQELPDGVVPPVSRDALAGFINSLPQPRGTARLQLDADPSLGALRMAPFALLDAEPTMDQIVDLGLNGVTLLFTWTPTGDSQ